MLVPSYETACFCEVLEVWNASSLAETVPHTKKQEFVLHACHLNETWASTHRIIGLEIGNINTHTKNGRYIMSECAAIHILTDTKACECDAHAICTFIHMDIHIIGGKNGISVPHLGSLDEHNRETATDLMNQFNVPVTSSAYVMLRPTIPAAEGSSA
jgi:hypothetical protein